MRSYLFQVPLLVAASASAHLISITIPAGQEGLQESLALGPMCFWSGTAPFCQGSCDAGYNECGQSYCGDGKCCATGMKKFCCRGECPESKPGLTVSRGKLDNEAIKSHDLHTAKDEYDDVCPPGEHIMCPPQAENNKDCVCLDDEAAKRNQPKKSGL